MQNPIWRTTIPGFGGLNIVLMAGDMADYRSSGGDVRHYLYAVRESRRIRHMRF